MPGICRLILALLAILVDRLVVPSLGAEAEAYFKVRVVNQETRRGVPLVELTTVNHLRYVTDSAGLVAFREPGLMGGKVFFQVRSHGYEYPKDGFGFGGIALDAKVGGSAEIKIKRLNVAERLYRVTGEGIYRDSHLLGLRSPLRHPLSNAQVAGQDGVMAVLWHDKIYWFWGDTNRMSYPLGLFQTSGATSLVPGRGGLDPSVGVDLEYFADQSGFSRAMCPISGPGPVWIEGLFVVPDERGHDRLATHYMRMKSLGEMYEHGLAVFDETTAVFKKCAQFDLHDPWRCPRGHPVSVRDGGAEYFLFPSPYATVRVAAKLPRVAAPASYEAFTCLAREPLRQGVLGHRPRPEGRACLCLESGYRPDRTPPGNAS